MGDFEKKGYITKDGKIKVTMKTALLNGTLDLSQKYKDIQDELVEIINKADKMPPIRDASRDVIVRLKKQVASDDNPVIKPFGIK